MRKYQMSYMAKPRLLTPQNVADRLGISTTTLSTWRSTKRYPLPYVKVGRLVRYQVADVDAFEISRLRGVVANDN
jgi:excisionase family DNA binding protein